MRAIETGGPAFPATDKQSHNGISASPGMDLRDYFAAKAMQGMLSHPECDYTPLTERAVKIVSADAYAIADAMLAERLEGGAS